MVDTPMLEPVSRPMVRTTRRLRKSRCTRRFVRAAFTAAALYVGVAAPATAQDPAAFYRGKTVRIVVGFSSGGGYDVYARMLARHIGRYIPGNPPVVVQN